MGVRRWWGRGGSRSLGAGEGLGGAGSRGGGAPPPHHGRRRPPGGAPPPGCPLPRGAVEDPAQEAGPGAPQQPQAGEGVQGRVDPGADEGQGGDARPPLLQPAPQAAPAPGPGPGLRQVDRVVRQPEQAEGRHHGDDEAAQPAGPPPAARPPPQAPGLGRHQPVAGQQRPVGHQEAADRLGDVVEELVAGPGVLGFAQPPPQQGGPHHLPVVRGRRGQDGRQQPEANQQPLDVGRAAEAGGQQGAGDGQEAVQPHGGQQQDAGVHVEAADVVQALAGRQAELPVPARQEADPEGGGQEGDPVRHRQVEHQQGGHLPRAPRPAPPPPTPPQQQGPHHVGVARQPQGQGQGQHDAAQDGAPGRAQQVVRGHAVAAPVDRAGRPVLQKRGRRSERSERAFPRSEGASIAGPHAGARNHW
ncbi:hypothetical protein chiPu_0026589 [Chiloscyllium punctatum]|uniref:Uncharacterized protein n=1 Tax=Chiloscyllium punctatum TaxID=137246 RepID=A0A401TJH6_CHIPU|nr:hypothetical protein [Chiloscyllium punctatum]